MANIYLSENSFQPNHTPKRSKADAISFWAFLLSIFIYISIFYVFSLSPSTLLKTTKFWFSISNTLIIIIAADFGAFSSSKKHDLCEEYVQNSHRTKHYIIPSPLEFQCYPPKFIAAKNIIPALLPPKDVMEAPQEKIKEVVVVHETKSSQQEKTMGAMVIKMEPKQQMKPIKNLHVEKIVEFSPKEDVFGSEVVKAGKKKMKENELAGRSSYVRSKSDKAIVVASDVKRPVVHRSRSTTQKHEEEAEQETKVEENEFSSLSNEELNRRVEEFIQNCNRQIRLQASPNFPAANFRD